MLIARFHCQLFQQKLDPIKANPRQSVKNGPDVTTLNPTYKLIGHKSHTVSPDKIQVVE